MTHVLVLRLIYPTEFMELRNCEWSMLGSYPFRSLRIRCLCYMPWHKKLLASLLKKVSNDYNYRSLSRSVSIFDGIIFLYWLYAKGVFKYSTAYHVTWSHDYHTKWNGHYSITSVWCPRFEVNSTPIIMRMANWQDVWFSKSWWEPWTGHNFTMMLIVLMDLFSSWHWLYHLKKLPF